MNCWLILNPAQHINHVNNDTDEREDQSGNFTLNPAQHNNHTRNDADEKEDKRSSFIGKVPGVAISLLVVAVVIAAIISIILAGVCLWRKYVHICICVYRCAGVVITM